jgi:quinol monooxygenase YgiN
MNANMPPESRLIARILTVDVDADRLDDVVRTYRDVVRPIHARADGLLTHLVLADRTAGRMIIIGVWSSPTALTQVADELEPARERLWAAFDRRPEVQTYDVMDTIGLH